MAIAITSVQSQCMLAASTPIPDEATQVIQFAVSGLINNSLSSPTQGICGLEITFVHEYLGDLTISLVSPAGTIIQLIGPATTAISPTNLSQWNIDFVPCMTSAAPDPGFTPVWSNLQAWQALTPYTGTYHPQTGCFEDFNTGPANGIWQLIVQDHDQFQVGSILEATLIFCDPTGLQCQECSPNAGTLSPTAFSVCSGENIQSGDITVDFGGNVPPAALYGYEYIFLEGNTILQSGASFSITPAAGQYSICGMSYLLSDAAAIDALIAADDYSTLVQAIDGGVVCAQLTTSCIQLDVSAKPDTIDVSGSLCNGEVFSFGGQDYTSDGTFYQLHDGPGLCDTIFEIRIIPRTLTVMTTVPDTLSCGGGAVVLASSASGASGPFTFQWTTINGNIVSSPATSNISVDQAGQYFVEVSDGICEGNGSSFVVADQGFPQVFFEGGTISCDQPIVDINPIYIPSGGMILWTGPSGFTSMQPAISVSVPGTYVLNVTNQAGCSTSRSVDIGIDTSTVPIDIVIISKDCANAALTIGDAAPNLLRGWQWTGPNGFATDYWRPIISQPGLYTLTGTFNNGCTRSGTYLFDGDFSIPDLSIPSADTLNCNEVIDLVAISTSPGVTYSWSGPQGFSSSQSAIQVTQEGTYHSTVVAPNGCANSGSLNIVLGDDIFDFEIVTDTLTCSTSSVNIGVIAPDADIFEWLNYSGPDADQSIINVNAPGTYSVEMTDAASGCIVTAEVLVYADFVIPSFSYTSDTIRCNDPIAELNFAPNPGYTYHSIYWELPDLSIVPGPTLMSGAYGEHRLYASSPNGCTGIYRIHIPVDTVSPFLILESDTLICADTIAVLSQTLDSITSYQWSGPGIVGFNNEAIDVDKPGWYHLSAFGLNGCPAELDILVDSNFVLPAYTLLADSLRCDRPAELVSIAVDEIVSYEWLNQSGMVISTDSNVLVNQPGGYTIRMEGTNHCISDDTVIIDPLIFPTISLSSDTFTCLVDFVQIDALVDLVDYTIAWLDTNGDTISTSLNINVFQPGPFIASVRGLNACETRDTILVPFDTISPVAIILTTGDIGCHGRPVLLNGTTSSPTPLSFSWTSIGGSIIGDPSLPETSTIDTGLYILEVQRLDNGCIDSTSFHLHATSYPLEIVELVITSPECIGDDDGSIFVSELYGGVGDFLYQLDGGPLQSSPTFSGLEAGTYLLTVSDAENCVFDTAVIVLPSLQFTVDAGPDLEIYLGETIQLSGTSDLDSASVLYDQWETQGVLLCTDCPMTEVGPLETTTYTYQVSSPTGCVMEDQVIVYLIEKGKYFIANIFSPNGDGINDEVRINPSPGIARVLQWVIFDRWGNAVFGDTDFDPNDVAVFWDGRTTTGDFANPGVFPYMLEIQLINGVNEVYHGSITLVR